MRNLNLVEVWGKKASAFVLERFIGGGENDPVRSFVRVRNPSFAAVENVAVAVLGQSGRS